MNRQLVHCVFLALALLVTDHAFAAGAPARFAPNNQQGNNGGGSRGWNFFRNPNFFFFGFPPNGMHPFGAMAGEGVPFGASAEQLANFYRNKRAAEAQAGISTWREELRNDIVQALRQIPVGLLIVAGVGLKNNGWDYAKQAFGATKSMATSIKNRLWPTDSKKTEKDVSPDNEKPKPESRDDQLIARRILQQQEKHRTEEFVRRADLLARLKPLATTPTQQGAIEALTSTLIEQAGQTILESPV